VADAPDDDERPATPVLAKPAVEPGWRRVPIDLIALVAIALVIVVSHRFFIYQGMGFGEPSWYFHFGHRVAVQHMAPYRDFVFHGGPLPIYLDAVFQGVFSSKYAASLYAALLIKVIRVWVIWMIVRRIASVRPAIAIAAFCAIDPLFAFASNWSTPYVHLFTSLAALFLVLATRAEGRRATVHFAAAGLFAALTVSADPRALIAVAIALLPTTALLVYRKELATRSFVALWSGFAAGFALVLAVLAALGALGPALSQMFGDMPGTGGVLDAISGGALVSGDYSWFGGFLRYLGVPCLVVAAILWLGAREREISIQSVGLLLVPIAFILGLLGRYAEINYFTDLPRMFFTVTTALAVIAPDRLRSVFGVSPLLAIAFGALPLACDWAADSVTNGRSAGDSTALVVGVLLFTLASQRLTAHVKFVSSLVVALAAVINLLVLIKTGGAPYAQYPFGERPSNEAKFIANHRRMRGIAVTEARRDTIQWLKNTVPPKVSCFIYGNLPVLYTLLDCKNPTRLDSTAPSFATADDLAAALVALKANPPDYFYAHERMYPPLLFDLATGRILHPGVDPTVHAALRELLADYVPVGRIGSNIQPWLATQAALESDQLDAVRVYRRKSVPPP
jgi:hypothetical protein